MPSVETRVPAFTDADPSGAAREHARRVDRKAAIEYLVCHLAHRLGSPLNVIDGRAAMMATGPMGDETSTRRNARIIGEQSARMTQILSEVVSFCRSGAGTSVPVDVLEIARSAISMLGAKASRRGATIALDGDGASADVRGNPDTLLVLLTHLLENGVRATPEGGALTVRLRNEERPEGPPDGEGPVTPFLCIDVDDDGPGIEAHLLPNLFDPFATGRDTNAASGIGLFIAQAIAKDHGGWLEGANKEAKGARFTLHLPRGQHAK